MKTLSKHYSTDGKLIYCDGKSIPNSHPATFKIVEDEIPLVYYFAYDKNQLYALSGSREGLQIWTDVDLDSLEFFPEKSFFADKNHLFLFNWHFIEFANTNTLLEFKAELQKRKPNADAWWNKTEAYYDNLKILKNNFFTDSKNIFFHFKEGQNFDKPFSFGYRQDVSYYSIIPNADHKTFMPLNDFYSKDAKTIFYVTLPIAADVESFEVIKDKFAKDKNGFWYNGYFVKESIDVVTFEIVQLEMGVFIYSFVKDKNKIFSTQRGKRIGKYKGYSDLLVLLKNSDPETFTIINHIWAKDKNNVYCYGQIWNAMDATSFEYLFTSKENNDVSFVKDKNTIYNSNGRRAVKGIDGKSFKMLNEHWGKDDKVVFNFNSERVMKSLDADSFSIIGEKGEAEDKNVIFKSVEVTHAGIGLAHYALKKIKKK